MKPLATETYSSDAKGNISQSNVPIEIKKSQLPQPIQVATAKGDKVPVGKSGSVMVTYVNDGDTFAFNGGFGPEYSCRVDLINAPETPKPKQNKEGQPFAEESKKYLEGLILNKQVDIFISKTDNYGRNICQVEIRGKDIQMDLVKQGLAWVYDRYVKGPTSDRGNKYKQEEAIAKKERRGLWSDPNPINPETFNHRR